jgi:hypothetical protein
VAFGRNPRDSATEITEGTEGRQSILIFEFSVFSVLSVAGIWCVQFLASDREPMTLESKTQGCDILEESGHRGSNRGGPLWAGSAARKKKAISAGSWISQWNFVP